MIVFVNLFPFALEIKIALHFTSHSFIIYANVRVQRVCVFVCERKRRAWKMNWKKHVKKLPFSFKDATAFREFLLVKLINGEKATFQTPTFSRKRERTLDMLIKDLYEEYAHDTKTVSIRICFANETKWIEWMARNSHECAHACGWSIFIFDSSLLSMVAGFASPSSALRCDSGRVTIATFTVQRFSMLQCDCCSKWVFVYNFSCMAFFSLSSSEYVESKGILGGVVWRTACVTPQRGRAPSGIRAHWSGAEIGGNCAWRCANQSGVHRSGHDFQTAAVGAAMLLRRLPSSRQHCGRLIWSRRPLFGFRRGHIFNQRYTRLAPYGRLALFFFFFLLHLIWNYNFSPYFDSISSTCRGSK